MHIFNKRIKKTDIETAIVDYITQIYSFYLSLDNTLFVGGKRLNLRNEEIKKASLSYDLAYYFEFFNAVSEYRERLKQSIVDSEIKSLLEINNESFAVESRIKNINSIFSKIYQYINIKKEKGCVSINKCLNDLFGLRLILPLANKNKLLEKLNKIAKENNWHCKIIDASKLEYKAIHFYMSKDNYSLPWEIQFWLLKDDAANRQSHAKYKQSYTSWELSYDCKDLYRECK